MRILAWSCVVLQIAGAQAQPAKPAAPAASAEAHLEQASVCQTNGDLQCAVAQLRQSLELRPDFRGAHGMLGEILLAQGFAAEAVPHLERAGRAYLQAIGLIELDRLPDALQKLLPLYRQNPDPDLLFHLGEASGQLMNEAFSRLVKTFPDSPEARELRMRRGPAQAGGDPVEPETLSKLLAAYVQHPNDPAALFQAGQAAEKMTQQAFGALVTGHPDSARAQEFEARYYLGQRRDDLAEPLFRRALKSDPGLPGIHLALGRILADERGDLDGGEREFRAEVRLRPGDAEAAWRLGSVLLKKGQAKEALAELQRSDKLKPDMLETLLELGKAYSTENQIEQAERVYRHMIEIDDTDELAAAAHLQLSQIYRKLGKPAEAEQHLKRLHELSSRNPNPQ